MKTIVLFSILLCSIYVKAQSAFNIGNTSVEIDTILTGLDVPWEIIWGTDKHIWVTERNGIISRINPRTKTRDTILNIKSSIIQTSESGLLGMALHPNFINNPEVFIVYTYYNSGSIKERLVKYTYDGNLINPVILLDNITGASTHIGSRLLFLPDTTLLMTTGDAQLTFLSQDTSSLSGKVLRMHTDGSIPADNPFPNSYVYSFGHRNIQGMCMAPNGKIYLSEHGASSDDEFQILIKGKNYGWPNVEGFCNSQNETSFCATNNVQEPLTVWTPTIAPADLTFYENSDFPEFNNHFLLTILKDKKLVAIKLSADGEQFISETHYLTDMFGRLRDICIGDNKEIFLATNGESWSNTDPNTHSIIRIKPPFQTGLKSKEKTNNYITLYPNPANNFIELSEKCKYKILDLTGRILIEDEGNTVSIEKLSNGIYQLNTGNNYIKFVKQ